MGWVGWDGMGLAREENSTGGRERLILCPSLPIIKSGPVVARLRQSDIAMENMVVIILRVPFAAQQVPNCAPRNWHGQTHPEANTVHCLNLEIPGAHIC